MSIASPVTISNERQIQPMDLSLEQLSNLKSQHEQDIMDLNRQLDTLVGAKNRFLGARANITELSTSSAG